MTHMIKMRNLRGTITTDSTAKENEEILQATLCHKFEHLNDLDIFLEIGNLHSSSSIRERDEKETRKRENHLLVHSKCLQWLSLGLAWGQNWQLEM